MRSGQVKYDQCNNFDKLKSLTTPGLENPASQYVKIIFNGGIIDIETTSLLILDCIYGRSSLPLLVRLRNAILIDEAAKP